MIELLNNPEAWQFIRDHASDDPAKLALKASNYPHLPFKALVAQISARQKAKSKLPEWSEKPSILFPSGIPLEQCSSEATAQLKSSALSGNLMADLTGGTGIDCYYISRKFSKAFFIEQQAELCALAQHNFEQLEAKNIQIENQEAETWIENYQGETLDLIYLDPARRDQANRKMHSLSDCTPNVVLLRNQLLAIANKVIIKTSPLLDISLAIEELETVSKIWVIAVNNECKEVLYWLDKKGSSNIEISTFNVKNNGQAEVFRFNLNAESSIENELALPQTYLYEPNSAVMKAGAFKSVGAQFGLSKLHTNSHLYTSLDLNRDFPGRIFQINYIEKIDKKALKTYIPELKANLSVRNFPDSVESLRKKLGLKEGGDQYLFVTTLMNNKGALLITEKV